MIKNELFLPRIWYQNNTMPKGLKLKKHGFNIMPEGGKFISSYFQILKEVSSLY